MWNPTTSKNDQLTNKARQYSPILEISHKWGFSPWGNFHQLMSVLYLCIVCLCLFFVGGNPFSRWVFLPLIYQKRGLSSTSLFSKFSKAHVKQHHTVHYFQSEYVFGHTFVWSCRFVCLYLCKVAVESVMLTGTGLSHMCKTLFALT